MNKQKKLEYNKLWKRKWRRENLEEAKEMARKTYEKWKDENPDWQEQHKLYLRKWRTNNRDKSNEINRQWRAKNPEKEKQIHKKSHLKRCFGSVEQYNEAMLKYEGECAFACGKQAEMVHHRDGKSIRNSRKEEVNNDLTNLLPLCIGCHTWLHKPYLYTSRCKGEKDATARSGG